MRLTILLIPALALGLPDLDDLRRQLNDADSGRRASAAKALVAMNSLEATRLLPDVLLDENAYVRDMCFTELLELKDPESIAFLVNEAMKRPEPSLRLHLAEWAGEAGVGAAVPTLSKLLRDKSADVRLAAAHSLMQIGDPAAVPALEKALREKKPGARAVVLQAYGTLAGAAAAEVVRDALGDKAWEIRVAGLALARPCLPVEEAVAAGAAAMEDKAWPVRAAAIALLAGTMHAGAVEPLIAGLEAEGRLRHDAHAALLRLTGKDIPLDVEQWREWWAVSREGFAPPGTPVPDDPSRKTKARVSYHGVPVVSHRIAFVLDLSGSMRDPAGDGTARSLLEVAMEELARVIDELPEKGLFNIYFYNEETHPWRPEAAPATPRARKEAKAFLAKKEAKGYTNLYGGLQRALADLQVDTIYLLSDGGPSRGEVIFTDRILRKVDELNRIRRVTIHAIDTGSRKFHQTRLLEELAARTGGRYVRIVEKQERPEKGRDG